MIIPLASISTAPGSTAPGGVVAAVQPDSPAAAAGLRPGDRVLEADGHPLWDVLDYQFHTAEGDVELLVERAGQQLRLRLTGEAPLGIQFADPTFDGIRRCRNRCPFCFVHQNPRGARRSLYIKDDDYRYAALYGGFITLTNFSDEDWRRIAEQRLSPLNVSVHATELELRRTLLGNPRAPDVLEQIRRLLALGIVVNTQVVLCPGLNDGPHLARTIADLAELHPGVRTLSVVPVGLTDNGIRRVTETRRHTPAEARAVVAELEPWRRRFRRQWSVCFVYPSDELYLLAELPPPSARYYDGFHQFSNGVGMVRSLLDEVARLRRRRRLPLSRFVRATAFTGTLAAPVVARALGAAGELVGCQVEVVPVVNRYFGPSVTVAGLLTAGDVLAAGRGRELGDVVLAPGHMLDAAGARTLDDVTPAELAASLGRPLRFASTLGEALRALAETDAAPSPADGAPGRRADADGR